MKRYVFVVMDLPLAHPAKASLQERLPEFEPQILPYGGVKRRIRLSVDTADAIQAARIALDKLALVASDWGDIRNAFVDEVKRVEPVDPSWDQLL